jgi:outer membrane protein OmpA-like peptidoglycan-associated protein
MIRRRNIKLVNKTQHIFMILNTKRIHNLIICLMVMFMAQTTVKAQDVQPTWWFGLSGAANFNFFDGTTQRLNNTSIVPAAFHKGNGVGLYGSALVEYRPGRVWGAMLNLAYDSRAGKFNGVIAPCNCPATLKTNVSYFAAEPSLRFGFKSTNLYFFAGPRLAINLQKDFNYTQLNQDNNDGELSEVRKTLISGQVGVGYEFPISKAGSSTQWALSPFVSYHPYFGQDPRSIESWSMTTVRAGIALKFGKGGKTVVKETPAAIATPEITFTVTAPKDMLLKRHVSETLPLLGAVFFDEGSTTIPSRYMALTKDEAIGFKESQLQTELTTDTLGRSARQLNVYHNLLNIVGDRMRLNPATTISLAGASAKGKQDGLLIATAVKDYLVTTFGIAAQRITIAGSSKPVDPSVKTGATKELALLNAEDRRVDIKSSSAELLMEVGGAMMKSVQINATQSNPMDGNVILNVGGAKKALKTWSVDVTDNQGSVQHYGPFTSEMESVPGNTILGNQTQGDYKVTLVAETKDGLPITKDASVHLVRQTETLQNGLRYSILFNFDETKTVRSYEKFLTEVVAPSITDGSTVIIHGHTDLVGAEDYNQKLADSRAQEIQKIIQSALTGKKDVKFETIGFGEDLNHAPFENGLPEERFYNRTVIIDITVMK